MVEFRVLGPVEVEHIGRPVDVGRRRERCLLGILLLHAGTAVPVARLIDLLWDGEASEAARAAVRVHVSRLRSRLGIGDALPVRSGDGYLMRVEPESVDALRFRGMVEQARGIVPAAERAALLRQALGLWRGPLLADAASDRLRDRIGAPWTELRLAALEAAIESELDCGRHRELVGELTALTAEHPERERFTGMLMLALYRSARQAEALEVFARRDRWFREELGLDPGPELRELHQRILASDPDLLVDRTSSQPATPTNGLARIVPRQLPAAVRHFTGRAAELKVLSELLPESAAGGAEDSAHNRAPVPLTTGVSEATRPSAICTTRLAYRWASSGLCVTTISVWPAALRSRSRRPISSPVAVSTAPVGSSASSRDGRLTRARAMATRCRSPPESRAGSTYQVQPTAACAELFDTPMLSAICR